MTSKDFIVVADIIKAMPKNIRIPLTLVTIEKLKKAYPNFDPITFADYVNKD